MSVLAQMSFQAPPKRAQRAPFVLLTGGKGGVGKTTLATNLGVQLAETGKRVLLVDLDLGLANVNVMLRLNTPRNIEDALSGEASFKECVIEAPGGLHVLPAGSGTTAMGKPDEERRRKLLDAIHELSMSYDIILGDSAGGIGHDVLDFATRADRVVIVTTPQPMAMTDAYGLIKALDTWALEQGREIPTPELFVNQSSGVIEAETTGNRLKSVCERFLARAPRMAGWMPFAADVAECALRQRPFASRRGKSLENQCLGQFSRRIARLSGAVQPASTR